MYAKGKKEAILRSVLKLVNREGFYHINMKKIADEAHIAPGTIYLYFKGKEALINDLYLLITSSFNQEVLAGFQEKRSLKENFCEMLQRALAFYLNAPDAFSFIEQYTYAPFLFKENREENFVLLRPIFKMMKKGKKEKIIKSLPDTFLLSMIHGSLNTIIKLHLGHKEDMSRPGMKEKFIDMVWNAISVD